MKWVRYQDDGGIFYGLLNEDRVTKTIGSPFTEYESTNQHISLTEVRILPPAIPKTFYAAGINYKKHVIQTASSNCYLNLRALNG